MCIASSCRAAIAEGVLFKFMLALCFAVGFNVQPEVSFIVYPYVSVAVGGKDTLTCV